MKKNFLFLTLLLLIFGCKPSEEIQQVTIKGRISHNMLGQESKDSLTLADAKKILVFSGINESETALKYSLVDIIDSSFTATSDMGSATALIFLDANYKYIGNLSNQGLNLLPLGNLAEGETSTIDLKDLQMTGGSILPSHDPFGNEIIITPEQLESLKELDNFFEALAKNLDADNDGYPELLDEKQIFVLSTYHLTAGKYGVDNTPYSINDSIGNSIIYDFIFTNEGKIPVPQSAILTGPMDSAYTDIVCQSSHAKGPPSNWMILQFQRCSDSTHCGYPFRKGIYTLDLDGKKYTFDYSCSLNADKIVLACPTFHLNNEGKISSMTMEYKWPDNTSVDPANILQKTGFWITGFDSTGMAYGLHCARMLLYEPDGGIPTDNSGGGCYAQLGLYNYTFPQPIDISQYAVIKIEVSYRDMLGNSYVIAWE